MRKKALRKGFSLLEILIVVAIIAILTGAAVPYLGAMRQESRIARAKGELRALQSAVESFYVHHNNTYPSNAQFPGGLETATPNIIGGDAPQDPFNTGNEYGYDRGGTSEQYYVIYSVGTNSTGSAEINDASNTVSEVDGNSCIYVSNAGRDPVP
ncbi:MAG: prepilin-type N-terminal cleavage/methylation domain-containing protein [Candidatus Omnitrophica bacterium]|nr:prepilin-type N-terminal cleavage/methylation domain-containing protein [Candidatus Omnitrophota bacterium]